MIRKFISNKNLTKLGPVFRSFAKINKEQLLNLKDTLVGTGLEEYVEMDEKDEKQILAQRLLLGLEKLENKSCRGCGAKV